MKFMNSNAYVIAAQYPALSKKVSTDGTTHY